MSVCYTARVTLRIDGAERDVQVAGYVIVEPSRSRGVVARVDGPVRVRIDRVAWVDLDALDVGLADNAIAEEALCTAALEDDSCACIEERDADTAIELLLADDLVRAIKETT